MTSEQTIARFKENFLSEFAKQSRRPCRIFLAASDMNSRAIVRHASAMDPSSAFDSAFEQLQSALGSTKPTILRADWVTAIDSMTWQEFTNLLGRTRRNYFRRGVALPDFSIAFTDWELNANLMLYKGGKEGSSNGIFNAENSDRYSQERFGRDFPRFKRNAELAVFDTAGVFIAEGMTQPLAIDKSGHRSVSPRDSDFCLQIARNAADHLARQVNEKGKFVYGLFPCTDRVVPSYNTLRHFSSIFAMLDVFETYDQTSERSEKLRRAIVRGIDYAVKNFVIWRQLPDGTQVAYIEEPSSKELKLGALGVPLVTLTKFTELLGTSKYMPLMQALARGIFTMQNADGSFVHVLNSTDFSVKEPFRIVYYDGEAVFGMMRLYSLTCDEKLLAHSELAFKRFIETEHWRNHDHWLSYAVNELTRYQPRREYFEFGINNFIGHLNFIRDRDTQYPTLMELMMAADTMLERMKKMPDMAKLLERVPFDDFYTAMEARAANMLNGYFYPETAMYFARPKSIVGAFFMRHWEFRARNDDIEHFLSGFAAYRRYLARAARSIEKSSIDPNVDRSNDTATIFFAGDTVIGRRMHWRVRECKQFGDIPAMKNADFRLVNLECVAATAGEQGIDKNEGGPFYFHARPEMLNILTDAKIDAVLTANNHTGDYGTEALLEEQKLLDAAGLMHCGSGANVKEASTPIYIRVNGLIIAIYSVDATMKPFAATETRAGTWYLPPDQPELWRRTFEKKIAEARQFADIVIVAPHWGENGIEEPVDEIRTLGRILIDCGADAVLGCHSHFVQGVESYRERPIVFDAGNFLFGFTVEERDTGCFLLTLDRNGVTKLKFTPLSYGYGYVIPAGNAATQINDHFSKLCNALGTKTSIADDGTVEIDFAPSPRELLPIETPTRIFDPKTIERHQIAPLTSPRPEWTVKRVPQAAAIEPIQFGSLKLVGYRIAPELRQMTRRCMLFVETYWTTDAPIASDCRLSIRGLPVRECSMAAYGAGMEHDFCDWMFPVNRWTPGVIYREKFGLRPPETRNIVNVNLQVLIRVRIDGRFVGSFVDPQQIEMHFKHVPYYRTKFPDIIRQSKPGQCWNAGQLEAVTGGKWLVAPPDDWFVNSVTRDRKFFKELTPPTLFVASTGAQLNLHESTPQNIRPDTHEILPSLVSRTAGAIVSRFVEGLPSMYPQLLVEDPIEALMELGFAARQRFQGRVIATTGTVGKSSVTDMLVNALQDKKFITTKGNYNARVGPAHWLASLPQDYDYAFLEIAMSALWRRQGPITYEIRPNLSIITQIGFSQTNNPLLKTIEDVARIKSKVFWGLTRDGVAVIHDQLECFDLVFEQATEHASRVIVCGSTARATSKILEIKDTDEGHEVCASIEGEAVRFKVSPHGMASVMNMMLVLGALKGLGEDIQAAIRRLDNYKPLYGRLECHDVEYDGKSIRVIDDSWNATVLSMKRALDVAPHMKKKNGRLIGALGRIVNLGSMAPELHRSLKDAVIATHFDYIVTHGDEMKFLREVLPKENLGPHFSDTPSLIEHLKPLLRNDDTILCKGSRRDSDFYRVGLILSGQEEK